VIVLAISTWEVAMLVQKGRLEFDRPLLSWIRQALTESHVELVPLTPEIAARAAGGRASRRFGRSVGSEWGCDEET